MNKVDVIIFKNLIFLDKPFTYLYENDIENGSFVIVNFNNSLEIALVINSQPLEEDNKKYKEILKLVEELKALPDLYIKLGLWMRKFYVTTYGKAFGAICDFTKIDKIRYEYVNLTDNKEIQSFVDSINKVIGDDDKDKIRDLLNKNLIEEKVTYNLIEPEKDHFYKFNMDISQALKSIRSNATRQLALVLEIFDVYKNKESFSLSDLKRLENYERSVFDQLVNRNIFQEIEGEDISQPIDNINLSQEQETIYEKISTSSDNKFLIHGVTGSGKTEIYFKLIEDAIGQNKGVIFLVPEISLTPQMESRILDRFGNNVAIIHSKLTKKQRVTEIDKIESGKSKILLGTRSAIFIPVPNLQLIIIDEEHDKSYKLDENNKYDAREIGRFLIENINDSKLILGSATPSIETYYKADHKVYKLLELKNRHNNTPMPKLIVCDMREEIKAGNISPISKILMEEMEKTLAKGKQVLLFLNRRGFAPFVSCKDCGEPIQCDRCDISMVYHKKNNYLECHYCGQIKPMPKSCPNCSSSNIRQFGLGTEKLEEMIKSSFPNSNILRIDSDTTSKVDEYDRNVRLIENRQVDIIIGTQMISKGFDFPDIDLVGVLAADLSLNIPEYYSGEDTYQILTQVSGRAGRSRDQGTVVIQTYNPDHYSIVNTKDNNYKGFYEEEKNMRKAFLYPPFTRQYILTIISNDYYDNLSKSKEIFNNMEKIFNENALSKYVEIISSKDRLLTVKINNRFRTKIIFTSRIKYEKEVKNSIYNLLFDNIYKMDLRNTHVDLVYS